MIILLLLTLGSRLFLSFQFVRLRLATLVRLFLFSCILTLDSGLMTLDSLLLTRDFFIASVCL